MALSNWPLALDHELLEMEQVSNTKIAKQSINVFAILR
jgi:hypothetical protein